MSMLSTLARALADSIDENEKLRAAMNDAYGHGFTDGQRSRSPGDNAPIEHRLNLRPQAQAMAVDERGREVYVDERGREISMQPGQQDSDVVFDNSGQAEIPFGRNSNLTRPIGADSDADRHSATGTY